MKKIIIILAILTSPLVSICQLSQQYLGTTTNLVRTRNTLKVDSCFVLPILSDTTFPTGQTVYKKGALGIFQEELYMYDGTAWVQVGGGSSSSSDTNALATNTPLSTTLDTIQRNGLSSSTLISSQQLQQRNNGLGVTQDTTKGISLVNYTAAANGAQQISPPLQQGGQGWATGVNNSQTVRFNSYVLPVQAATNPTATWVLQSSINNGPFGNGLTYTSSGNLTTAGSTTSSSFSSNSNIAAATQYILNSSSVSSQQHRTTNGGANVQPLIAVNNGTTAGNLSIAYETTNQLTFDAANGTRQIARAGIGITNLVNTAGSETGNLAFSTQDAGAAMAERVRITNTGNLLINTTTDVPSSKLTINSTTQGFLPPRMTAAQRDAIGSPATGLTLFCTDCTATDASTGVMQTYNGANWKNYW